MQALLRKRPLLLPQQRTSRKQHLSAQQQQQQQQHQQQRRRRPNVAAAASPNIETDAAARLVGRPADVADYLSRVDETWPAWYPRLVSARRAAGAADGRTFDVVVRAAGGHLLLPALDLPVEVRLLERTDKRVAFSASSPLHEAREQYVLMPCPSDARGGHTAVRHVSEVWLRGAWAGALAAPVVGGIMRAAPREALARLEAALRLEAQQQQPQGQGRRRPAPGGADGGGNGPFWGGLFGSGGGAAASSPPPGGGDPHGLYAALGLDPRALVAGGSGASGGGDAEAEARVRAAYRRRAKALHPDAHVGADAAAGDDDAGRRRRGAEYARVQRAYAVLRDASARRRYDRGEWSPDEEEEG